MSGSSSSRKQTTLVLPLIPSTIDPSTLLPTIYRTVVALSADHYSLNILFCTPQSFGSQIYSQWRSNPSRNFNVLQAFLARVYACLAAAQWTSGKILLNVEVLFAGETGLGRIQQDNGQILLLEGYEDLLQVAGLESLGLPRSTIPCPPIDTPASGPPAPSPAPGPPVVALGGTFDHLHAAHKLLLHLALFLSTRKLIVGVMSDSLLSSKVHAPLVQNVRERIASVEAFLHRHGLRQAGESGDGPVMDVVEIHDAFGPTAWDADIQALVVSSETLSGGEAVNRLRKEKGLPNVGLFVIDVIASTLEGVDQADHVERVEHDGADAHADAENERRGKVKLKLGDGDGVRTLDLSGERDEKKLKELKMGSTAIRQWIAEHGGEQS